MTTPRIAFLLPLFLLGACAGGPPPQANFAYYDLAGEPVSLPALTDGSP